jgi:hypothetical protein
VLVLAAAVIATVALARTKWAWLAAAATVCLSLPRFFVYDSTYLLIGTTNEHRKP